MSKKNVMTTIDIDLHQKAKDARINVSALLERAIENKVKLYRQEEHIEIAQIAFSFEERDMKGVKEVLFAGVGVRAKRCSVCNGIWFVNDTQGEWKICRDCRRRNNQND